VTDTKRIHRQVVTFALSLPGAHEDHPWGETVAKVGAKVFAFFGADESPNPGMTVKLRESNQAALGVPGAIPARYGLGKSGWVTLSFRTEAMPPFGVLSDWVEESYRLVAPKRLIAELDVRTPGA
jgi:predicted DNA-binding protein (MmcQ/YjbR family)